MISKALTYSLFGMSVHIDPVCWANSRLNRLLYINLWYINYERFRPIFAYYPINVTVRWRWRAESCIGFLIWWESFVIVDKASIMLVGVLQSDVACLESKHATSLMLCDDVYILTLTTAVFSKTDLSTTDNYEWDAAFLAAWIMVSEVILLRDQEIIG